MTKNNGTMVKKYRGDFGNYSGQNYILGMGERHISHKFENSAKLAMSRLYSFAFKTKKKLLLME